jgi:hypothetical protein
MACIIQTNTYKYIQDIDKYMQYKQIHTNTKTHVFKTLMKYLLVLVCIVMYSNLEYVPIQI